MKPFKQYIQEEFESSWFDASQKTYGKRLSDIIDLSTWTSETINADSRVFDNYIIKVSPERLEEILNLYAEKLYQAEQVLKDVENPLKGKVHPDDEQVGNDIINT